MGLRIQIELSYEAKYLFGKPRWRHEFVCIYIYCTSDGNTSINKMGFKANSTTIVFEKSWKTCMVTFFYIYLQVSMNIPPLLAKVSWGRMVGHFAFLSSIITKRKKNSMKGMPFLVGKFTNLSLSFANKPYKDFYARPHYIV